MPRAWQPHPGRHHCQDCTRPVLWRRQPSSVTRQLGASFESPPTMLSFPFCHKTIVAPKSTTILGWIWRQGHISASNHRISTLKSWPTPQTVKGLRSFIGAYKVLARVLPDCASNLADLKCLVAGRDSSEKLKWSDTELSSFVNAQSALSNAKSIALPRPDDKLWIVTDGALKPRGKGATLYAQRNGKLLLAGFFSAKYRKQQVSWLPCEIEALSISIATRHFSPYIIQSHHQATVLTDSKPCVQAYEKLCRGEFSASPRVSTF